MYDLFCFPNEREFEVFDPDWEMNLTQITNTVIADHCF